MSRTKHIATILVAILSIVVATSCSIRSYVPEGSYLLTKNTIETDLSVPRTERIPAADLTKYIKQRPAMDIWGIRQWLYTHADSVEADWIGDIMRTIGTPIVLLDSTLTRRSAKNMEAYVASRGFFSAEEEFSFKLDNKRRTAQVTYTTFQGDIYHIDQLEYLCADDCIEQLLVGDSTALIHRGDVLDINRLGEERTRIANLMLNNGYYDFTASDVEFRVDTTLGNHLAAVEVLIHQRESGEKGPTNHPVYRIGSITVLPDYDATRASTDPDYYLSLDTLRYKGLNIVHSSEGINLRPKMLRKLIKIQSGTLYNQELVTSTYDNLMAIDYVRSANILFSPAEDAQMRPITFIGDHWSQTAHTLEGTLDCQVRMAPSLSQSYKVQLEASTTSSFYGLSTSVGYQNRNFFRGGELFDLSFIFGYELLRVEDPTLNRNSIEIGGRVGITFPQFLLPWDADPLGRLSSPQTRIEFSISDQNRRYYDRVLSNLTLGYSWGDGAKSRYTLRPIDVSLVKMNYVSQDFLDRLQNPYLHDSYTTQMMAGISGSYAYGAQTITSQRNYKSLRINLSTSGNAIAAAQSLMGSSKTDGHYTIFGIPYAQYVRTDLSWAESVAVGENSSFAYRLYGGIIYPYGNSRHESLPADRLFYAGGINSMRGWTVRTLGPGGSAEVDSGYPSQFGNLRLEANAEIRFPLWNIFNGAVFVDAGNIWYTPNISGVPDGAAFRFDTFFPQIALNTGFGLRLNLKVLVLRLDMGLQLHNPNRPEGERWVIGQPKWWRNTSLNFGIGYPF